MSKVAGGDDMDLVVSASPQLEVWTFNEDEQLWLPVPGEQEVDPASGTVTAHLEHFSVYSVIDRAQWFPGSFELEAPCTAHGAIPGTEELLEGVPDQACGQRSIYSAAGAFWARGKIHESSVPCSLAALSTETCR